MDFISLSMNYWEDLRQSRHEVMSRLARKHKVLFVSPPFYIRNLLDRSRKKRLPKSGLTLRENNLYTFVPSKWLFVNYAYPRMDRLSSSLRKLQIKRVIKKLGFQNLVSIIWNPYYSDLVGGFDEKVCCYYVDDEFSAACQMTEEEKQDIAKKEQILLRGADIVFASGVALFERKNLYGNAINVPNGVNFELFSRALLPETQVFPDLALIPSPRIGYVGNVNDKVDYQLLSYLAARQPDWSIVLVGPVTVRKQEFRRHYEELKSLPNVYFLGFKPQHELPNYVKGLDVCMMCYRTDLWAYFGYPLKLHEYLAGGKPAVASDLPSLREFRHVIRIARTREEWLAAIQDSLAAEDPSQKQARVEVARQNTWEVRIKVIEEILGKKMAEKV